MNNTTQADGEVSLTEKDRFKESSPCRDPWWAVAFVIQLFIMIILSFYYYGSNSDTSSSSGSNSSNNSNNSNNSADSAITQDFASLCFLSIFFGILSSVFWLFFVRACSTFLIWFTLLFTLALWIVAAIILFAAGSTFGAILCVIIALFQALWIYCVRDRIAFASAVLKIAITACNQFSKVYYISILSTFVQAIWYIIWITGFTYAYYNNANDCDTTTNQCGTNSNRGILFLFVLSFYWTSQVIANIVFVTTAGTVGTWYFLYPNQTPSNPVLGAFKRSIWNSLGSIAFGSFLIALIQTIKFMLHTSSRMDNPFIRCCVQCILNCLQNIIEYFNVYAFATVAIYGYSYCQSARATLNLFASRGWTMLINDDLIGGVLVFACLFAGILAAIAIAIVANYGYENDAWVIWAIIAFFVGYGLTLCIMIVVRSGVATIFVCWSNDPVALQQSKPIEYQTMALAWNKKYEGLGRF